MALRYPVEPRHISHSGTPGVRVDSLKVPGLPFRCLI
jgi:hypothetical protein